jgi:hypothetical protein
MTSAAPGSAQGNYLIVSNIDAARDQLAARGAEVSEVFTPGRRALNSSPTAAIASTGPRPITPATAHSPRSTIRTATAGCCRRSPPEYVLELDDGSRLRGDQLLVATGRRPRVENLGLETVGVQADGHGVQVNSRLQVGERLSAVGDITGIWQLTHVGEYQGEVVASNILGEP